MQTWHAMGSHNLLTPRLRRRRVRHRLTLLSPAKLRQPDAKIPRGSARREEQHPPVLAMRSVALLTLTACCGDHSLNGTREQRGCRAHFDQPHEVRPNLLPHLPCGASVDSCQSFLDVTNGSRPSWRGGGSVSRWVVSLGQDPLDWDLGDVVRVLHSRRVDREPAAEFDGPSGLSVVTSPPVEYGAFDRPALQCVNYESGRAGTMDGGDARRCLQAAENRVIYPLLVRKRHL